ncbi:MAG: alcohol dehydrogenase catalytic domain-containing protein [Anaerolineae bacterium]
MRGVLFLGDRESRMAEFPDPVPGPGQVVIEMKAAGICGSDLHFFRADREFVASSPRREIIPGHEPAGVVHQVGPGVMHLAPGDRVAVLHVLGCYRCSQCLSGYFQRCKEYRAHGRELHGAFADYLLTEAGSVVPLPEWASFAEGAIAACAGSTGFWNSLELQPSGKDTVVVFGLGPVGLSAAITCQALGAFVVGVEPVPERRELAAQLGITRTLDPRAEEVTAGLQRLTGESRASLAIEASGNWEVQRSLHTLLVPGGKAMLLGIGHWKPAFVQWELGRAEITLIGRRVFPIQAMHELFAFLKRHDLRFDRMVTHRYPLEEAQKGLLAAEGATSGKVLIEW